MSSFHIYGRKAAFTIDAANLTSDRFHTIALEASTVKCGDAFVWDSKIIFQLGRNELPELLAVLMGWHQQAHFQFHGAERDKELLVERREGVFMSLRKGSEPAAAVRASPAESFRLAVLALRQLQRNFGGIASESILAACRANFADDTRSATPGPMSDEDTDLPA